MRWVTKESSFRYNGKPVTRRTATTQTPLGEFKVYEAVGGNAFMCHPYIQKEQGLVGFEADPFNTFGKPRIRVKSIEDGVARCEAKWNQVKDAINSI